MGLMLAGGIRFNDYVFSEPVTIAEWRPPKCAGILVILAKDPHWSPKPFQPLYFGEFGNNSPQTLPNDGSLFVAVLPLPYSTTGQRWSIRNELVWAYNPVCQHGGDRVSVRELAHRLDEIEIRQQEQNSQLMLLLTNLNKIFEPQTVGPRRPIGFQPVTEAGSSQ